MAYASRARRLAEIVQATEPEPRDMMSSVREVRIDEEDPPPAMLAEVRSAVEAFDALSPREIASRSRCLLELDRLRNPLTGMPIRFTSPARRSCSVRGVLYSTATSA